MAMPPAAQNSNSYASSALAGGNSASGAILGIPQDPSAPRGPQPQALPQGMPGGVPNFFASPSVGLQMPQQQPTPQPPSAPAFDQINAQNQQVIAQMFGGQNQQPQEPVYGLGPNGELQVGDQVAPMQDNPTAAAQLIQQAGNQPTKLRPGFTPVRASEINNYLQNLDRGAGHALYETGKQALGGATAGALGVAGNVANWANAPQTGAALAGAGQAVDRFLGTDQPPDTLGHGALGTGFINAGRSLGMSVPIMAANAGLVAAGQPELAGALDFAVVGPAFGADAAQQTQQRLISQGVDPATANKAAWQDFFNVAGTQGLMSLAGGAAMGGGGAYTLVQRLGQAVKGGELTAEQAASMVTNPAFLKRFGVNEAANMGVQGAGMAAQGAGSAAINNAAGGQHQDVGDAALEGAQAGLFMGAAMTPLSAYHQWGDSTRRAQLGQALNTPSQQVDLLSALRTKDAATALTPEVGALAGKQPAQDWAQNVTNKAFNTADANQFRADQARVAQAQPENFSEPAPAAPEVDPEAVKAQKQQARAQQEAKELSATKALSSLGVEQPKPKDVSTMIAALDAGIDLTSPESETFRDALLNKKYALAREELAKLSAARKAGPPDAGVPPAGGTGAGDGAGSVGTGEPVVPAGVPTDRVPRRAPAPSDGTGKDVAPATEHAPAPVESDIPDFSLTPPPPKANANWLLAHPEEEEPPKTQPQKGQKELFGPKVKLGGKTKPELTAEQAWNRLKTGLPKYADLPKEHQARIDEEHAAGRVTQEHWDAAQKRAQEEEAAQNRERVAVDSAKQAGKSQQELEEERTQDSTIPSVDLFKRVFGEKGGTRLHAAASGMKWADIGKLHGEGESAPRNYVNLPGHENSIEDAQKRGAITPSEAEALTSAVGIARENAGARRDRAVVAQEGAASTPDLQQEEINDLVGMPGVSVQRAGSTNIKTKQENDKGRSAALSTSEENLVNKATQLEAQRQDAIKRGDRDEAVRLMDQLRELSRRIAANKDKPLKEATAEGAATHADIESQLEDLNYQLSDAEENGDRKEAASIQKKIDALKEKREAATFDEEPRVGPSNADEAPDALDQEYGSNDGVQWGKNPDGSVKDGYTSGDDLHAELAGWMGVDKLPRHIKIVDTAADLTDLREHGYAFSDGSPFGWAKDGRVVMIADRIPKGQGEAAFLHEVGVHLGLERILGKENVDRIHEAIKEWAARNDGSRESEIAKEALARVEAAGTKDEDKAGEALAYFVQVATERGVDPTAVRGYDGRFAALIRQIYAAFKNAVRRVMRGGDITKMSAEDMVNMAFGAARLESAGTFHGTAAEFRKFNHKYMGAGEGAQAYGWGTYVAQRLGIAKGYHADDVGRKTKNGGSANYAKEVKPKGNLMRVDHTVPRNRMLDWDNREQSPHVRAALDKLWDDVEPDLREHIEDGANIDSLADVPGKTLIRKIFPKLREEDSRIFDQVDPVGGMPTHEVISKLLDHYGIGGTKFLDQPSRNLDNTILVKGKEYTRDDLLGITAKGYGNHELHPYVGTLRQILRHGMSSTINEYEAQMQKHLADGERITRESHARYDVPISDEKAKADAQEYANKTFHKEQLDWLKANKDNITVNKPEATQNHVIFNDKNLIRVGAHPGADMSTVKFGKTFDRNIEKLPEHLQEPVRTISSKLDRWANSALDKVVFTKELVDRGVARGMTALRDFHSLSEDRNTLSGHYSHMAYDAIEDVRKFSDPEKRALSDFLMQSNLDKQWGFGPRRIETSTAARMYDDLSDRAKDVARAVFEHGQTMLQAKKEAIQELAHSLYGDMMDEAKAKGRQNVYAELKAERDTFLKKYKTLMDIDAGDPYSSLQRRGDFVAVGKSEDFLQAEAKANAEGASNADRAAYMAMVADPQHYLVSEAQSEQEAKLLRQNMRDAGFPASGDHTYYKPKAEWAKDNGGVIAGMGRLRAQLDMMSRDSANPIDRAHAASMRNLLTHMWLDALSQRSARKAELRRQGVHGTMDAIGSFRQAAVADAHFISGIKFNDKMLGALKKAQGQADTGEGEDRTTKLNMMNEFLKRHEDSTNGVPTPWANKITKTVALWQIATSPAHYVGNLMQPWTMTLPYLAAQHGYGEATGEFFKAYKEIGGILGKTGLLSSLKVADMPADVRGAMSRLLELGRLDIGMNTEYTSMDLNIIPRNAASKALTKAGDLITQASLKMESLNRLASAAAAYRLELARTGDHDKALHYAGDVVAETHGDHSRANAPRAFNTGFGKIALQFRKFQLVQLTQMAKMIGNLKDADPDTRRVALRTLAFTAAHVAALGGAIGMPGFNTFSAISQTLQRALTGIDGEDWETKLEKSVGDVHVAQLLLRGLPGLAGVDLTSKVGYGDMLGVAPYTDVNVTDRKSVEDAVGQVVAGPFGGLLGRAAQSLHHLMVGNYYKGLEGVMPQGISNVMKGAREGTNGVSNTKNDKLMNLNAGEAMLVALGFEPSSKAMQGSETTAMIKNTEGFKDRLELLKERYDNQVRAGSDPSGVIKDMNVLRETMMERGFKPTSLGDLIKSPTEQLIRQIFTTPGGVQYKPGQSDRAAKQFPK